MTLRKLTVLGSFLVWVAAVGCSSGDDDGGPAMAGAGGSGQGGGAGGGSGGQGQGGIPIPTAGTGGTAGSSSTATAEEACASYLAAQCARIGACAPLSLAGKFGDEATCVARLLPDCLGGLGLPKQGLTPETVLACGVAYQAMSCEDLIGGKVPTACNPPGGLPNGAACGEDHQCQSTQCLFDSGKACGVCKTRQPAGGACSVKADCELGLTCSAANLCVTYKQAGESCDGPCQPGLSCYGPVGAKKCGLLPDSGEKCDPNGATGATSCSPSSTAYCDPASKVCKNLKAAQKGDACGPSAGFVYCQASVCLDGVCQPYTADGEKCGT